MVVTWENYSQSLAIGKDEVFKSYKINEELKKYIQSITNIIFNYGIWMQYIRFLVELYNYKKSPFIYINNEFDFENEQAQKIYTRKLVRNKKEDDSFVSIGSETIPGQEFIRKKKGEIVTIMYRKKVYRFKIININKEGLLLDSEEVLKEYIENIKELIESNDDFDCIIMPKNVEIINEKMSKMKDESNEEIIKELNNVIDYVGGEISTMDDLINKVNKIYDKYRRSKASDIFY